MDHANSLHHGIDARNKKGITVSFDGNFRSTLWIWEEARDFCTQCLPYIDVLMGIEPYHLWKDETDHSKGDVKDGVPIQLNYEQQDEIFRVFIERYPNPKCIVRYVHYAHSGSENSLKLSGMKDILLKVSYSHSIFWIVLAEEMLISRMTYQLFVI